MKKRVLIGGIYLIIFIFIEVLVWNYSDNKYIEVKNNDDKITLKLACSNGDLTWVSIIKDTINKFEEINSNIDIELMIDKSKGLYEEYMMTLAATGNLGDIVEIRQTEFFTSGYMAELPRKLVVNMKNKYEINGQTYGINNHILTMGVIYNRQIFRMLGLDEPRNYEEFIKICEVLKRNGYTPLAVGGGDEWHMKSWLNHFYLNDVLLSNPNWEEDLKEGKVSWLDEEPKKMFTHLYELFTSGYIDKDWRTDKDSLMATKIASGNAVMLYSGTWMFNQIYEENPSMELGWFFVPNENGDTLVRDNIEACWGITKECSEDEEKYNAAVKFLEFYFSEPIYTENYTKMGAMSNKINNDYYAKNDIQKEVENEFHENINHTKLFLGDENYSSDFQKVVLSAELLMINNEITIDEALKICNEEYLSSISRKE